MDRAGKYRLGPLLGVGGMAEVYAAHVTGAEGFERRVAIKRVLSSYSANAAFARMFVTEARLASMLASPHIVAVLDFDRDAEGRLYQVMEYVDGVDLEKLAPPGRGVPGPVLPPPIIAFILAGVLMGLRHAHGATHPQTGAPLGIVHRDCTPSNVLIGWDGAVKLSDFGVAKARQATFATVGSVKGKPMYMAPEQLAAAADMDGRVDLFAVGVMLWELLTGRRPFAPDGDANVSAVLAGIALYGRGDVRIDTAHAASGGRAPVALSNLAARLMAARPADRPPTAHDALAELRTCGPVATADDLALLLAQRFPDRAPAPPSALLSGPAPHSMPTNVIAARAGPPLTVATIAGAAGSLDPVGNLGPGPIDPAILGSRRRRRLARAIAAVVAATATAATAGLFVRATRRLSTAHVGAIEGGAVDPNAIAEDALHSHALHRHAADARATHAHVGAAQLTDAQVVGAHVGAAQLADAQVVGAHVGAAQLADGQLADAQTIGAHVGDAQGMNAHVLDAPAMDAHVADAQVGDAQVIDAPVIDARVINAPRTRVRRQRRDAGAERRLIETDLGRPGP